MEQLKMLLGITDNTKDELLQLVLDEVKDTINAYCYTDKVPSKLEPLIPVIAADVYRSKGYGSEQIPKDIKGLTESSRKVEYETQRAVNPYSQYYPRMKRYRRARVPSSIDAEV